MYFSHFCVCRYAKVQSISVGCNSQLCVCSVCLILGPAAFWGHAPIIMVMSGRQEVVTLPEACFRTITTSSGNTITLSCISLANTSHKTKKQWGKEVDSTYK